MKSYTMDTSVHLRELSENICFSPSLIIALFLKLLALKTANGQSFTWIITSVIPTGIWSTKESKSDHSYNIP